MSQVLALESVTTEEHLLEIEEKIHHVDLEQIERIESLAAQLAQLLTQYRQTAAAIAVKEEQVTALLLESPENQEKAKEQYAQEYASLNAFQQKLFLRLRGSVFKSNNKIKQLHDRNKALRISKDELSEIKEE